MNAFLAIDWGTTNRRIYRMEGAIVRGTMRDGRGVKAMAQGGATLGDMARGGTLRGDYAAELAAIRRDHGDLPVLMAGMVGSTIGWRDAGYVALPATLPDLAGALCRIDDRTFIVPGACVDGAGRRDVMRGEEVQVLGAVVAGLAPPDALLCQPGTHCKWARMAGGRMVDFTTAMSGELFAMLAGSSVMPAGTPAVVTPGTAFDAGVAKGGSATGNGGGDLAALLFSARADAVLGHLAVEDIASHLSGILIGADVAARLTPGEPVRILADPELGGLYLRAVEALGGTAAIIDSHRAFAAGIHAIWESIA